MLLIILTIDSDHWNIDDVARVPGHAAVPAAPGWGPWSPAHILHYSCTGPHLHFTVSAPLSFQFSICLFLSFPHDNARHATKSLSFSSSITPEYLGPLGEIMICNVWNFYLNVIFQDMWRWDLQLPPHPRGGAEEGPADQGRGGAQVHTLHPRQPRPWHPGCPRDVCCHQHRAGDRGGQLRLQLGRRGHQHLLWPASGVQHQQPCRHNLHWYWPNPQDQFIHKVNQYICGQIKWISYPERSKKK